MPSFLRACPLATCLLLAVACGGRSAEPSPRPTGPTFRRVADITLTAAADEVVAQLRQQLVAADRDVVALLDAAATAQLLAADPVANRHRLVAVVPSGAAKAAIEAGRLDAAVELADPLGIATELAALGLAGASLPPAMGDGPTLWTRANLAAGGQRIAAPADFVLTTLRNQFAAAARTTEASLVLVHAADGDAARREGVVRAALTNSPRITLAVRAVTGEPAAFAAAVDAAAGQPHTALLLVTPPGDATALATACRAALAAQQLVVTIGSDLPADARSCHVTSDEAAVGRACGEGVLQIQPGGGRIAEVTAATEPATSERRAGFAAALHLP